LRVGVVPIRRSGDWQTAVDFNPNLDFSKFKLFAFIGGVEQLVECKLNPDTNNRIHRP